MIVAKTPPELHGQVRYIKPDMEQWGVRVTIHEDMSARIEFPEGVEVYRNEDLHRPFVRLTVREPGWPVDAMGSWSFDADMIEEES